VPEHEFGEFGDGPGQIIEIKRVNIDTILEKRPYKQKRRVFYYSNLPCHYISQDLILRSWKRARKMVLRPVFRC
jgi:hypothetical protein